MDLLFILNAPAVLQETVFHWQQSITRAASGYNEENLAQFLTRLHSKQPEKGGGLSGFTASAYSQSGRLPSRHWGRTASPPFSCPAGAAGGQGAVPDRCI